jgi:acyl-coenzyme A thioesterase PaaI-like protein
MALIDTCMVFVAYAGLGRYAKITTVSQETRFMRPVIGKDVIATGVVSKAGKSLLFGQVTLTMDGDERPVCDGISTYAILE